MRARWIVLMRIQHPYASEKAPSPTGPAILATATPTRKLEPDAKHWSIIVMPARLAAFWLRPALAKTLCDTNWAPEETRAAAIAMGPGPARERIGRETVRAVGSLPHRQKGGGQGHLEEIW